MNKKFRDLITGLLSGIFIPAIAYFLFVIISYPGERPFEILERYAHRNVLTHVISLAVIANLPVFFIYLNKGQENVAQGIIGATILYAILIVVMKFLL